MSDRKRYLWIVINAGYVDDVMGNTSTAHEYRNIKILINGWIFNIDIYSNAGDAFNNLLNNGAAISTAVTSIRKCLFWFITFLNNSGDARYENRCCRSVVSVHLPELVDEVLKNGYLDDVIIMLERGR